MAKFYGKIGYAKTEEQTVNGRGTGVCKEIVTERYYSGDILRDSRRYQSGEHLNDDLNLSNELSILADPYAYQHYAEIRYAEWMGARWKVTDVEVQYPRLRLTIGGVYNGPTAT